jgi:hypothetical protein
MSIITSPEFFINIKKIPDKASKEYLPFFRAEMNKVKQGVTIAGVRIPGWLYWHINHWVIDIDVPVQGTNINYVERRPSHPFLRDNDWIIAEHIERAESLKKGVLLLGTRQLGKSEIGASYNGRRGIAFENSQNVIAGLSDPDLKLLLGKLDRGFTNLHPYFKPIKIINDPKKEIILGYKDPQGERVKYSEFLIRNLDSGKNTENLAGPTTSSLTLDECGKGDFLEAFIAAKPALETAYGWRGMPLFIGTSGSFDKAEDLQRFRENLDTYNFIEVELKDEKKQDIYFIPGWMSSRAKRKKIRLSTYKKVPKGSELDTIAIHVVENPEEEIQRILDYRESLKVAGEITLMKKETMYYPLNEEELFLIDDSDNIFSDVKEICKAHLLYLETIEVSEEYGWMTRDENGKPKFVPTKNAFPIKDFPAGEHEDKDAPIIIWSHPMEGQEFGILHVGGIDPYNQDESFYSPSLGTLYIYRRTYDPLKGNHQESFVASYSARTKTISKWREQVRLLLEYYGATALPENEEPGLIRWFDEKHIGHYLEDGLDLAKEINPNTTSNRNKGLSATTANIRYGNGLLKSHINEDLVMGQDPLSGENIIKKGVIRIKDKVLLKEVIAYTPAMSIKSRAGTSSNARTKKKATNVDRIVGARHALILAKLKDKYFPLAKIKNPLSTNKPEKKAIKSPFTGINSPFGSRRFPFGGKL